MRLRRAILRRSPEIPAASVSWFQDQRASSPGRQYTTRHGIHVDGTLLGFPLPSLLAIFYNQILHFKTNRHREHLVDNFPKFVSAEVMSSALVDCAEAEIPDAEVDWVWIAITCLWERWQPNLPNMEMVDDKMQAGYAALNAGDTLQACRLWLETWRGILDIIDRAGMDSLDEFDDQFRGTQSVFNWVQDFESELHNAGMDEPRFLHERISLCEMMLDQFSNGRLAVRNSRSVAHGKLTPIRSTICRVHKTTVRVAVCRRNTE